MKIKVHIERLVLEGLPVTSLQARQVQGSLETELARLLAGGGLSEELRGGIAVPQLRAGTIQLAADNQPVRLGHGIARAIYGGIGKSTGRAEGLERRTAAYTPCAKPGCQR